MKHARRRVESEESFGLRDTLIWCGIPIVIVLLLNLIGRIVAKVFAVKTER